eukprot:5892783-Heterocapsa_arctica.AAC.1
MRRTTRHGDQGRKELFLLQEFRRSGSRRLLRCAVVVDRRGQDGYGRRGPGGPEGHGLCPVRHLEGRPMLHEEKIDGVEGNRLARELKRSIAARRRSPRRSR